MPMPNTTTISTVIAHRCSAPARHPRRRAGGLVPSDTSGECALSGSHALHRRGSGVRPNRAPGAGSKGPPDPAAASSDERRITQATGRRHGQPERGDQVRGLRRQERCAPGCGRRRAEARRGELLERRYLGEVEDVPERDLARSDLEGAGAIDGEVAERVRGRGDAEGESYRETRDDRGDNPTHAPSAERRPSKWGIRGGVGIGLQSKRRPRGTGYTSTATRAAT